MRCEFTIALAVLVFTFPINGRLPESSLQQQLAQLWRRPQAPLVGERFLDLRAILEFEVNMATDEVRDRMKKVKPILRGSRTSLPKSSSIINRLARYLWAVLWQKILK